MLDGGTVVAEGSSLVLSRSVEVSVVDKRIHGEYEHTSERSRISQYAMVRYWFFLMVLFAIKSGTGGLCRFAPMRA